MKMLFVALLMLMSLVTISTIVHAKGPRSASYQCKHIGMSKVKPFKHKTLRIKPELELKAVNPMPKFRCDNANY
jgi:hypothetical protein